MERIHGVEDILLGFEPKDAGSIPAGSVFSVLKKRLIQFDVRSSCRTNLYWSTRNLFITNRIR